MVDDRRLTISTSSRVHPEEVARRTFTSSRRGFDPSEVKTYLEHVARELAAAAEREKELRELLGEAERRADNPVLDEETLTTALGQETARVLRTAHEAASDLVGRAEADANRMVTEAQEEAGKLQARAEQHASDRAAQSEAAAADLRQRAQEDAAVKVDAARVEAETLIEQARMECRAMLSEAQELRSRVLGDLARRRRVLHSQIEQLRAGRDRLAETISGVRHTVDQVTDDLFRAEDEARIAAEAAGRQLALQEGASEPAAQTVPSTGPDEIAAGTPEAKAESGHARRARTGTDVTLVEFTASDEPQNGYASVGEQDAPTAGADHEAAPVRDQDVEELFARLRAERSSEGVTSSPAPPPGVPEVAASAVASVDAIAAGEPAGQTRQTETATEPVTALSGNTEAASSTEPLVTAGQVENADQVEMAADAETAERDPLLARRDEVLGPIVATLARRLKRALTDDQNDILDRLRAGKSWGADVLPEEKEHIERYSKAGVEQLVESARAGATFTGGKSDDAPGVEDIASDLAGAIVAPLRRRLEGESSEAATGDEAAVVEQVGAAFRDWKGARIERLAGDEAVAAFSRAALAAKDSKTSFKWLVDDDGADCPDCDDNALAGPVPRGESFPTGHPHPPAHAGCRCLLAPVDA